MTGGPYLSITEAGAYLGVSTKTIRRQLREIPHHRADWGLRFTKSDLDSFMNRVRVEPPKARKADPDRILAGLGLPGRRRAK